MSDAITLRGMQFLASIGVLDAERLQRQPLEIDLTIWLAKPIRRGAASSETVDYRGLYDLVAGAVNAGHTDYLEDLAATIADGALGTAGVERTRVVVRKPHVALPGPLAGAEVAIERSRGRA